MSNPWIKLTHAATNAPFWVRKEAIAAVFERPGEGKTRVYIPSIMEGGGYWEVSQSATDIMARLKEGVDEVGDRPPEKGKGH